MLPKRLQKKSPSNYGKLAEDFTEKLLKTKGYKILERNFHSRFGEIDIVAEDGEFLVFVEVKARWSNKFGAPEEAVNFWKLSKIKKTIDYYLLLNPRLTNKMRIEVVAIEMMGEKLVSSKIIRLD